MHQICHEHVFLHLVWNSFEKLGKKVKKPGHGEQKTSKSWQNFHVGSHVFARCDKTVKVKEKIKTGFSMGMLYLSENVFVTA